MLILGIETSGRPGSVALCRDGECLDECSLEATAADGHSRPGFPPRPPRRHAQTLVAEIDRLFRKFGLAPRQCELVAVSIGPGSFTGLRIGVMCAKTFAYAAGCRVAAVDTFQSVAEYTPPDVDHLFVIGDAQRGELFVGDYHCTSTDPLLGRGRSRRGMFERQGDIAIVNAETWCRGRSTNDVVSGPAADKFEAKLKDRCRVLDKPFRDPRASVVARIGQRRANSGHATDPWSLEPYYLRKSAAEEKRQRRNAIGDGDASSNTV